MNRKEYGLLYAKEKQMIITESELRRIIRQEILNESLSMNSSEELLEEGFFKDALMALGLTAMVLNPVKAKADTSTERESNTPIESVADDLFNQIPKNCPSSDSEWWSNDIRVEDHLDSDKGEESVESYVKFLITLTMQDKNLHESIIKMIETSNEEDLPSDMVFKDMYYNPILKTKTFQNSNLDLNVWEYLKKYLEHHAGQATNNNDENILKNAIRKLLALLVSSRTNQTNRILSK